MKHLILGIISLALVSVTTARADTHWDQLITGSLSTGWSVEGATKVDASTAKNLHDRGILFIDNDYEKKWKRRHIPGAANLPWLTKATLKELVNKNEDVVFYCSGVHCYSSVQACALALTWGYENVYYFAEGFIGWNMAGYPRGIVE